MPPHLCHLFINPLGLPYFSSKYSVLFKFILLWNILLLKPHTQQQYQWFSFWKKQIFNQTIYQRPILNLYQTNSLFQAFHPSAVLLPSLLHYKLPKEVHSSGSVSAINPILIFLTSFQLSLLWNLLLQWEFPQHFFSLQLIWHQLLHCVWVGGKAVFCHLCILSSI